MRPFYETETDLANEERIAKSMANAYGGDPIKLPVKYGFDFAIQRKYEIVALLEAKKRNNERIRFPTLSISLHKVEKALRYASLIECPALIVVEWTDVSMWVSIKEDFPYVVSFEGARKDRDDPGDVEPMVQIPITDFRNIKPLKEVA